MHLLGLAALFNLVALALFAAAYRARGDQALRLERYSLGCAVFTLLTSVGAPAWQLATAAVDLTEAFFSGSAYVAYSISPLARALMLRELALSALLVPIPFAAWLGIAALRRWEGKP